MGEVIEENADRPQYPLWPPHHRLQMVERKTTCWTVEATGSPMATKATFTCNFLWMCQGYYDHEKPYIPDWEGHGATIRASSSTRSLWDPKTDYAGKRILVIGSGATAATVVPAFAEKAAHVTMLQRSPTYFFCSENKNELADRLREIGIDEPTIHRVVRAQIMHDQDVMTKRCQTEPEVVFEELKELVRPSPASPISSLNRTSRPNIASGSSGWPSAPKAMCSARRSRARSRWLPTRSTVSPKRVCGPASGEEIEADIIVAATGFRLSVMGDIPFSVDGKAGQLERYRHLSRDDVHRRAQHGLGDGLFPRQLDAAGRHDGRFCLQPAEPYGQDGRQAGRRAAAP
jgi:monooxygenase